jgi:hypothetical protein
MKTIKLLAVILAVLSVTACSTRMGQFTAASTMNVRNLEYNIDNNSMARTEGESCIHTVIIFPVGSVDDRIQRAMDDAIQNGRKNGLDGDLLVNARINLEHWYFPLVYGQNCITVEGDLVSVAK